MFGVVCFLCLVAKFVQESKFYTNALKKLHSILWKLLCLIFDYLSLLKSALEEPSHPEILRLST